MFLFAFPAGVSAALSPCVIILIPLLMVRFLDKEKRSFSSIFLLVIGFLSTFVLLSFFLQQLLNSSFSNGFRLGLGLLFITMGFQSLIGRMSPMTLPLFKNTFLLGVTFSILVVFNPCTIPYLGILVAMFHGPELIVQMILFALGMITPAILFTLFGQSLLSAIQKRTSKFFHWLNKLLAVVMIGSGVYLGYSIHGLTLADSAVAVLCLLLCFAMVIRTYADDTSISGVVRQKNGLIMIILLALMAAGAFSGCYAASLMKPTSRFGSFAEEEGGLVGGSGGVEVLRGPGGDEEGKVLESPSAQIVLTQFPQLPEKRRLFPVLFRSDFLVVHDRLVQEKKQKERVAAAVEKAKKKRGENGETRKNDGSGWKDPEFQFNPSFVNGLALDSSKSLVLDASSPSHQSTSPPTSTLTLSTSSLSPLLLPPVETYLDLATMTPRPTIHNSFPAATSTSSSPNSLTDNPLARVTCAAVAPCPGCKWCFATAMGSLLLGICTIMLLSPKKVDFEGIVHDTCSLPKFHKDKDKNSDGTKKRRRRVIQSEGEGETEQGEEGPRHDEEEMRVETEPSGEREAHENGNEGDETISERASSSSSSDSFDQPASQLETDQISKKQSEECSPSHSSSSSSDDDSDEMATHRVITMKEVEQEDN